MSRVEVTDHYIIFFYRRWLPLCLLHSYSGYWLSKEWKGTGQACSLRLLHWSLLSWSTGCRQVLPCYPWRMAHCMVSFPFAGLFYRPYSCLISPSKAVSLKWSKILWAPSPPTGGCRFCWLPFPSDLFWKARPGRTLPFLSMLLPFYLVTLMIDFKRSIEVLPATLVSGISFVFFNASARTIWDPCCRILLPASHPSFVSCYYLNGGSRKPTGASKASAGQTRVECHRGERPCWLSIRKIYWTRVLL